MTLFFNARITCRVKILNCRCGLDDAITVEVKGRQMTASVVID